MKRNYFKEEDIMTLYLGKKKQVAHSRELRNVNILLDFDKEDNIIGIEIDRFMEAIKKSDKFIDKIFKIADKSRKKK